MCEAIFVGGFCAAAPGSVYLPRQALSLLCEAFACLIATFWDLSACVMLFVYLAYGLKLLKLCWFDFKDKVVYGVRGGGVSTWMRE